MRAWNTLIRKYLRNGIQNVHARRLAAVADAVFALVLGARPTVTGIGRELPGQSERYGIKRADRLIGSEHLADQRMAFFQFCAGTLLRCERPVIHIDWSPLTANGSHHMLVATLSVRRRAIPLYSEVHPLAQLSARSVESRFLSRLRDLLPPKCRPVILADAGFRIPFCDAVARIGWDYVVRLRARTQVFVPSRSAWTRATALHVEATAKARDLGTCLVARSQGARARLVLSHQPRHGRVDRTYTGLRRRSNASIKHARSGREPWVLQTSLANLRPEQIVKLYARRMGIEESLRDAKNLRSGMGLACTLSRSKARLDNLVLLNILSMLFAWLIGAGADGHVLDYQANSIKDRRVLSFIFLGRRFARKPPPQRLKAWLASALTALQAGINTLEVAP